MMEKLIENSTINGVTHIHMAKNKKVKVFWISLIILGIGGIVVNVGYVIDKYLKYPVEVSLTFETTFEWPELTFCNLFAPFHVKTNSPKHIYWKEVLAKLDDVVRRTGAQFPDWEDALNILMDSIDVQRFGFNFRDSLIDFTLDSYDGRALNESAWEYFQKRFMVRYEMHTVPYRVPCYSLKLRNMSLDEYKDFLNYGFFLKLDQDSNRIFNNGYRPKSIYMVINNMDDISDIKSYFLSPGYRYTFDISQSRYIHRESGKSCRTEKFNMDLYDLSMTKSTTYEGSYKDCLRFHRQRQVLKDCKCYGHGMRIHKNGSEFPRLCLNISLFTVEQFMKNLHCEGNIDKPSFEKCDKYKPRKCDSTSYKISLHKEELFEKSHFMNRHGKYFLWKSFGHLFPEYVNRTDFRDVVRDSILQVVIRRENELVDLRREEYSYIFSQLLSDIGGLVGLYLGISVLGVFELAMLLYYFLKSITKGKKRLPKDVPLVNTTT